MIWVALLLTQGTAESGGRGAEIFAKSCAVAFCHGSPGAMGPAPQLAGRTFARDYLERVTRQGMPQTSMPGFQNQLKPDELQAVIAYVLSLNTVPVLSPGGGPAAAKPPPPSEEVRRGKELFFDLGRQASCGVCHLVEQWGVAIGPDPRASPPADIAALRAVEKGRVRTARPAGQPPFPALLVGQSSEQVRVYDLSAAPPVLRSFLPSQVTLADGSSWSPPRQPGDTRTTNCERS